VGIVSGGVANEEHVEILEEILILREEYRHRMKQGIFPVAEKFIAAKLAGGLPLVDFSALESDLTEPRDYFLALQEELTSTENRIGFARQNYNDTVMRYNTKIQTVPANLIAGPFGFKAEEFFEIEEQAEREVPKVK